MTRQIRFRGKSLATGEWVYGDLIENQGRYFIYHATSETTLQDNDVNVVVIAEAVDNNTIGQYINHEAANEKEIFVADYIRVNYKHEEYSLNGAIPDQDCFCLGEVVYMENALCYGIRILKAESFLSRELEDNDQLIMPLYYFDLGDDIEVIGNRFDNPELLEEDLVWHVV